MLKLKSRSAEQTRKIGREMGKHLQGDDVVLLEGELGAGKTTLVQGIARGLSVPSAVTSPTFTLLHEYEGRRKLFHFDWYRLSAVKEDDEEEFLECLKAKDAVCIIEWPERGKSLWPGNALHVRLEHQSPSERLIFFSDGQKKYHTLLVTLRKKFK